ncbi:transaldolase [Bradyrhizobium sp. LMG 8443]|jgi:transaldolase/glucose-6-phosphate isomerase|nr:transaldolase [Bradyrhizobium sp. LMG 8443]
MANSLKLLQENGQSVWVDFVARNFLDRGGLARLVQEDGVRGVTSNPAIFEKAIAQSSDYDDALCAVSGNGDVSAHSVYEKLAIEDIRQAADVLQKVYEATDGADGYVSLEVSPNLANRAEATLEEARRLWLEVARENLMIKVPATAAGTTAIRQLVAEGINVNATLLFSQRVYEDVANAYLEGLERRADAGGDVSRIGSVASFFVSRIDSMVDALIDEKITRTKDAGRTKRLERLKGRIAIANAKLAYQSYKRLFAIPRWNRLAARGARAQRLLWASTGTKNKAYSDVLYVEELIGPNTVNTMPPATLDAFRDHGRVRQSLEERSKEAEGFLEELNHEGIALDEVTAHLVEDGVRQFVEAANKLTDALTAKLALLGRRQTAALPS